MRIDSKALFRAIEEAHENIKDQIAAAGIDAHSVYFTSWSGYGPQSFKLEVQIGYKTSANIEGTDVQEMVEEAIHRLRFQQRQETLQLAAPVVEPARPTPVADDEEIPF